MNKEISNLRLTLPSISYAPVLASAMALMMGRLLLLAKTLPAETFGQISSGLLISSTFCMIACLGLQPELQRKLPILLARGKELAGLTLTLQCILIAIGCFIFLAILTEIGEYKIAGLEKNMVLIGLVHGLSQQIFLVVTIESRSRLKSFQHASQNFARSFAIVIVGQLAAFLFSNPEIILLSEAGTSLVLAGVFLNKQTSRSRWSIKLLTIVAGHRLKAISWSAALALLMNNSISFISINLDRWWASEELTPPEFGNYSFAWIILMIAQSAQVVMSASVFPTLSKRYADEGENSSYRLTSKISWITLISSGAIAIPSYYVLEWLTVKSFPAFSNSIYILPTFLFVACLRLSDYWSSYLIILKQEKILFLLNFISLMFTIFYFQIKTPSPTIATFANLSLTLSGINFALLAIISHFTHLKFRKKRI